MSEKTDLILSIVSDVEVAVQCNLPTGKRNGWREINFFARFRTLPNAEAQGEAISDVLPKALTSVDFGNLQFQATDGDGQELSARDVALSNTYTYNALLACYRDEVVTKNLEPKNSKPSRGR